MSARRRGEPLIALALILSCWVGARALAWDRVAVAPAMTRATSLASPQARTPLALNEARYTPWPDGAAPTAYAGGGPSGIGGPVAAYRGASVRMMGLPPVARRPGGATYLAWTLPSGSRDKAAALAASRPARAVSPGGNAAPFAVPTPAEAGRTKRWSADAWVLARNGTAPTLVGGPAPASYGASQAGAILRYALAPASRYRPAVYVRTDSALSGAGDAEVALGFQVRPLPHVPVVALAEARATRSFGKLRFRPAAMLVTQLAPFALPVGLTGEAYVQGGYVAGPGATPFVDGQFTFDRPAFRLLGHQLKLGGGVWGGAQKGAARLDVGPATRVDLKLNKRIFARLSLDYRLHVAGNAQPGSGPALTLGAGF